MRHKKIYTTTLKPTLLRDLSRFAKRYRMCKNELIEMALESYFEKITKVELIKSFNKAKHSKELTALSKLGLEDLLKIVEGKK